MLHPSYTDLMKVVNNEVEPGEATGGKQPLLDRHGDIKACKADYCRGGAAGGHKADETAVDRDRGIKQREDQNNT